MKVKDVEHKVNLDDFEHRVLIACVNTARTVFIKQGKPTEDVEKYDDIINEMHANAEVEAFKYGFRLATMLFIESIA